MSYPKSVAALLAALTLQGCAVVGATAIAADAAVGTAGFVIGTTGDLAEGTVHTLTPLGPDDDDQNDEDEDGGRDE